jgi:hypothetical protein
VRLLKLELDTIVLTDNPGSNPGQVVVEFVSDFLKFFKNFNFFCRTTEQSQQNHNLEPSKPFRRDSNFAQSIDFPSDLELESESMYAVHPCTIIE